MSGALSTRKFYLECFWKYGPKCLIQQPVDSMGISPLTSVGLGSDYKAWILPPSLTILFIGTICRVRWGKMAESTLNLSIRTISLSRNLFLYPRVLVLPWKVYYPPLLAWRFFCTYPPLHTIDVLSTQRLSYGALTHPFLANQNWNVIFL